MSAVRAPKKVARQTQALSAEPTFLETGFPFELVSRLAQRDRNARDGVYRAHKWWARRPPAVIRALLLAAFLPQGTTDEEFWAAFGADEALLEGKHVGDPFMGGATTLVEAARLGASVTGVDVDPLAVQVALQELEGVDAEAIESEAEALVMHLRKELGELWGVPVDEAAEPLHFFWLREASCGGCGHSSLLYRNLVLARDLAIRGAVVRDAKLVAFCPTCLQLHHLAADRKELRCCGRRHKLDVGSFRAGRYVCPRCGTRATHQELRTGLLPRVLVAVEEAARVGRRRFRAPRKGEAKSEKRAAAIIEDRKLKPPEMSLRGVDSGRPATYGFDAIRDLFTSRQLVTFLEAYDWVSKRELSQADRRGMLLGISNALATNNPGGSPSGSC